MAKKTIGNPLEQAIVSGTIGKKSEQVGSQAGDTAATPVRKVGRKPTKKDRVQHTIYLPPVLSKWVKIESYEQGREISDVMADAILLYKKTREAADQ
jgi:hypothetical protein